MAEAVSQKAEYVLMLLKRYQELSVMSTNEYYDDGHDDYFGDPSIHSDSHDDSYW